MEMLVESLVIQMLVVVAMDQSKYQTSRPVFFQVHANCYPVQDLETA